MLRVTYARSVCSAVIALLDIDYASGHMGGLTCFGETLLLLAMAASLRRKVVTDEFDLSLLCDGQA